MLCGKDKKLHKILKSLIKKVDKPTNLGYNVFVIIYALSSLDRQKNSSWKVLWEVKMLDITDIRVKRVSSEGKMKAIVSITFDNAFVVHDIKIIEGQDKLFTAMPSRKTQDNEYKDIAHPINKEMRDMMEKAIIECYERELKTSQEDPE